jgi:hypothetical protein
MKMSRLIDVGLPVSVARVLARNLQAVAPDEQIAVRRVQEAEHEPHPLDEEGIPDLTITHQISIMRNREAMVSSGYYETFDGLLPEMRSDLKARGFDEPTGYFKPICFVPLVIIHNRRVRDPPTSWEDLLDRRWKGRIGVPSPVILKKLVTFYAKNLFGGEADRLFDNVVSEGLPIDVNLKVDDGSLDVGIVSLPFARSSRNGNVSLCWPGEGALPLPEVLICKKGAGDAALRVGEYLLSDDVQRYISDVGIMVPVNPGIPLPREVEENGLNFFWKGWDWFVSGINEV